VYLVDAHRPLSHALLGFVTLLLATGLVFLGATRAARALGLTDALDLVVAASILAATQIVVTLLFAGVALRRLDLATVLVVNAAVTGALLVFLRPERRGRPGMRAIAEGLVLACRSQPLAAALAALAGLALAWRVVLALVLPPYGFDALTFHLPTVVGWLQVDRITTTPLNVCCVYYPENGEVLFTWPALLGGRAEYVDLVQIASALVGAAAVAGIARAALVRVPGAWIAASLFVLTPVLLAQSNTAYVDVTFTAEALAAFYLVLRYLEATGRERRLLLGCAGAATALCVGTKPTGIVFGLALALPLVVRAVARRKSKWREGGLAAALFALPIAVLGISWYLRSWIVTGNPFHPMNVRFLGATVFAGSNHLNGPPPQLARHSSLLQPVLSWYSDLHFWTKGGYSYEERLGGFGPVWSYFGAILVIVFAVHAWRRRRIIFWYFLVPMALFFAIQPDHWWSRYTLPLAAAGSIAVAWALTASWRPSQLRLALALATLVLAAGGAWIASKDVLPGAKFRALSAKVIIHDAVHGRRSVGQVFDPDYAWIDKIRHASPIAIDLKSVHMISPFAGARFQNRLLTLPGRGDLRVFVRTHRVEYVVTRKGSYYDKQAQGERATFKSLGGRRVRAYRVEPSRAAS
jgi:4-amino-4-deoxy-L-arabinose transferase-like glycosyltransferase